MKFLQVSLSPEWEKPILANNRVTLAIAGEGSGKSFSGGLFAVCHSVYDKLFGEAGLYWVVGLDFEDGKKDLEYIRDFQRKLDNVQEESWPMSRERPCIIKTKTGQTFSTVSAYDYDKIAREEPDGIVGAEVGRWPPEIYHRCLGRIARKYPRAWLFATGSPRTSQGWLRDVAAMGGGPNQIGLRAYHIPSWANRVIYPGGRDDPAIKALEAASDPNYFQERYGGLFVPSVGVIFSSFRYNEHVDYELDYDPNLPVRLAIDPGTKVYCVLFCQLTDDNEVRVVDEVYVSRWTHEQVINECRMRDGWLLVDKSSAGAIDVAAKQSHMGGPIPIEEWYKDTGCALYANKWPLDVSIERVRAALAVNPSTGRPRLRVHPRCRGLISEMDGGPSPVEGGGPWMYFEGRDGLGPPRSENNHACMALAYLLSGPFGFETIEKRPSTASASYLARPRQDTGIEELLGIGRR